MNHTEYDYIISGMGCAGLSLALHLSEAKLTHGKKILLIDRAPKTENDRTWCFWETTPGIFEPLVSHAWDHAWFYGHSSFQRLLSLDPYRYKMIRGKDFYQYCLQQIDQDPAFEIKYETITALRSTPQSGYCQTPNGTYSAPVIFNSVRLDEPPKQPGKFYLLQHFKGWIIETPNEVFDPKVPVLMDFRTNQQKGTAFVYVMPFSSNKALVEYTLFTPSLLTEEEYVAGLTDYLRQHLQLNEWKIIEEEFGVIPMTNHPFNRVEDKILHIGTAGGRTKPSSGYTFTFIQKDCKEIVEQLRINGHPFLLKKDPNRFHWYDSVLLHVLCTEKLAGHTVFTELFAHNPPERILRFLDNETHLGTELRILTSLPQWPFMRAGLHEYIKTIF